MIEEEAASEALERCTKQNVPTVVRKLKYLLYPILIDRCTAENASKVIGHQNDIKFLTVRANMFNISLPNNFFY